MAEQGLDAVLLFPTLGCGVEEALKHDVPATMASLNAFNRWLDEDWGFSHEHRLITAPMLSLADPDAALAEIDRLLERGARSCTSAPRRFPARTRRRARSATGARPGVGAPRRGSIPVAFHLGDSGYNAFTTLWGGVGELRGLR